MALHKHATMADLRGAIRHYRVIRFHYEGRSYTVEPHHLGRNPRTGCYELTAWVRSGDPRKEPGWRTFNYWKVRGLDVMPDNFLPRLGADRATDPLLAG